MRNYMYRSAFATSEAQIVHAASEAKEIEMVHRWREVNRQEVWYAFKQRTRQ